MGEAGHSIKRTTPPICSYSASPQGMEGDAIDFDNCSGDLRACQYRVLSTLALDLKGTCLHPVVFEALRVLMAVLAIQRGVAEQCRDEVLAMQRLILFHEAHVA